MRCLSLILCACVWAGTFGEAAALTWLRQGPSCAAAATTAEREHGLPEGLLAAIAVTESGRWDRATNRSHAWPWTVRAGPDAFVLDTKALAIAKVEELRRQKRRNIDVGCGQVNLHYHPDAFDDLEQAFSPLDNLRYAARFLKRLHGDTGDWDRAVARYHSGYPERGRAYLAKVRKVQAALETQEAGPKQRSTRQPRLYKGGAGSITLAADGFLILPAAPPPNSANSTRGGVPVFGFGR